MVEALISGNDIDPKEKTPKWRLIKDFYLSFRFSQGNVNLQDLLLLSLVRYYSQNLNEAEQSWIKNDANQLIDHFSNLRPPRPHYNQRKSPIEVVKPELAKKIFETEGKVFLDSLQKIDKPKSVSLEEICLNIVLRDTNFQFNERAFEKTDPHMSHLRQFVLLQTTTGSSAFDSIFHDMSELYDENLAWEHGKLDMLTHLSETWEIRHPGELFFSDLL